MEAEEPAIHAKHKRLFEEHKLAGSPARKSLQWSSKNISGTFDVEFAYVLGTRLPDLRVIDLSKNSIRITSSLLAEFVESFHDLRVLNLSVNALQKENCSLGKLTLEECRSIGKSKAIIDLSIIVVVSLHYCLPLINHVSDS